jgi:hypothetical protein
MRLKGHLARMGGGEERFIQGFCEETWEKETSWKV